MNSCDDATDRVDDEVVVRPFREADSASVIALWHAAGLIRPWNDPAADLRRKATAQPDMFLVADDGDRVRGTVMAGYDGHRGWIHYLAVAPDARGAGLGRVLLEHAEQLLRDAGCPKIQLQVRPDNTQVLDFYAHLGYVPYEAIDLGKRLTEDG